MTMRTLELAILAELKAVAKNPKLQLKDIQGWSTAKIKAYDGEIVIDLPAMGVYCAILKTFDRR